MKKITLAMIIALFSFSVASASELGLNVGVSLNGAVFHATGKSTNEETNGSSEVHSDDATGVAAYGEYFIEKTLWNSGPLSRLAIGYSLNPDAMSSETAENNQFDISNAADTTSTGTSGNASGGGGVKRINTVQVDFEDLTTVYLSAMLTESMYVKMGTVEVEVITNESLATGSSYGNTQLDGTMIGAGSQFELPFGLFGRIEATYMEFDGKSLSSNDNTIELKDLEGASGKLSIGKAF
jgi:hypothetical protein